MDKAELWSAGKSLLASQGLPERQCGSFVGGLVKQHGEAIVIDAVRTAVLTQPADVKQYLVATCQRLVGDRVPKGPRRNANPSTEDLIAGAL